MGEEKDTRKPAKDPSSGETKLPGVERFKNSLVNEVPENQSVDVPPAEAAPTDTISKANKKVSPNIREWVTSQYIESEEKRVEQQKPLLEAIIELIQVQIFLFNVVILMITGIVVIICAIKTDTQPMDAFLNLLKYYSGAVIVELLGLLGVVAKSVFSSDYSKVMEAALNPRQDCDSQGKQKWFCRHCGCQEKNKE